MDVLDWHLDHMFLLVNIYMQTYFENIIFPVIHFMRMTHEISLRRWPLTKSVDEGDLSRNTITHEISSWRWPLMKYHNSHEISSWRWPLTKYHKKPLWKYRCKPGVNVIFMRVAVTVNSHENNLWRWTLTKMCISWVYYHERWYVMVYPHALFSWE
jgi:hypothetical protein